jgi:type I restriction enzyme M protein
VYALRAALPSPSYPGESGRNGTAGARIRVLMNTSQWIRDRRTAAGLSQAELARRVGASQPLVSLWERGVSEPTPEVLKQLRSVLGQGKAREAPAPAAAPEPPARARRPAKGARSRNANGSGAPLGFEPTLWEAADRLRGHMDASEYKNVVLGLIFLKYISDAFEELHARLEAERGSDPEERDEYIAENIFWVPAEARWSGPNGIQARAPRPEIGKILDAAMEAIERENASLKGVLPRDYSRPSLDKSRLGELVNLVSTIGLGDPASRSQDVLGRVYEYFLGRFAAAEGKSGGEFFTPRCVVKLLVEMIEPLKGRVYDPCCGSGGMFVQSERFVEAHGGRRDDLSIYGQESNPTTWKLARMNLAIRGIDANLGPENGDSFLRDLHPDLKADFILANPPFNMSYWGGETLRNDVRWKQFGVPPAGNANYAWIQHFIHHLSPRGIAGFVLANGSLSSNQSGEGEIRKKIIEADLVDCIIALPPQLFYTTGIPACLWFLARDKADRRFRDRRGEALFIDARKMGYLMDRTHRDLKDQEEIGEMARTYHAWRGEKKGAGTYEDRPGYCKAATTEEIEEHGWVLTPGRYVGAGEGEEADESIRERLPRLIADLDRQFAESSRLEDLIRRNLGKLNFGNSLDG